MTCRLCCALAALLAANPPGPPATITAAPETVTLLLGQSAKLAATVRDAEGRSLDARPEWTLEGAIGRIAADGTLTAGDHWARGTATATVGDLRATVEVQVLPWAVRSCHHDGHIVYSVQDGGESEVDLYVMRADGSDPVNLTTDAVDPPEEYPRALDWGYHASYSPDARRLVFVSADDAGTSLLCMMASDGSDRRIFRREVERSFFRPSFSIDSRRVLCDVREHADGALAPADIAVIDEADGEVTLLTGDAASELDACYSPDGTRIAYIREREAPDGLIGEVWLMSADGADARRLTPAGAERFGQPAWSPDGTTIACSRRVGVGATHIVRVAVETGEVSPLADLGELFAWGPEYTWDGRHVLFASTDAPGLNLELWRVPAEGGAAPEPVTGRPHVGNYLRLELYDE